MKLPAYNNFCRKLPHVYHVVQWDNAHVWKVGGAKGKVFAIASDWEGKGLGITFKVSPMGFDILKEQPGLRPAPYLASRGLKWIQWLDDRSMDVAALRDYLRESHRLAVQNLPKAQRVALGLAATPDRTSPR